MSLKQKLKMNNQAIFFDVIPATRIERNPTAGTLEKNDLEEGMRIRIVGYLVEGSRQNIATVTSPSPLKVKGGDYEIEVVFDAHMKLEHPQRDADHYSKCCYQELSLRDIGILPGADGAWTRGVYSLGVAR